MLRGEVSTGMRALLTQYAFPLFDQMNTRCRLFTPETGLQLCCVATRCRPHIHVGIALCSRFARGKCKQVQPIRALLKPLALLLQPIAPIRALAT